MQISKELKVDDFSLLSILIEINQWEDDQRCELQTISGRGLYFKIAATLLPESTDNRYPLKYHSGRITDRAIRSRIREFQALGLVSVIENENDARSKRLVATDKFIIRLNHHLKLLKQLCDAKFLMVKK